VHDISGEAMKLVLAKFMLAALAVVLMVAVANAQGAAGQGQHGNTHGAQDKKPKVDEKAYSEALKSVPVPDKPRDPWQGAR
jgi:hypothetical protein